MKFRRRYLFLLLAGAGIVLGGFLTRPKPVMIETTQVQRGTISSKITASGKIESTEFAELAFQIGGKVATIEAKVGDEVKAGQIIAILDKRELEINLSQKQAALRAAQSDLEKVLDDIRLFKLSNPGITETQTQKNLREKAESSRDAAFEAVQLTKAQIKNAALVSPVWGKLVTLNINVGEVVTPGVKIAKVANFSQFKFTAEVDETEIEKLSLGQRAKVILNAFISSGFVGEVSRIHPEATTTQTGATIVKTEITLSETNPIIKLGLGGDAQIIISEKENILKIPQNALFEKADKKIVSVVKQNKIEEREVTVGAESEEEAEILEGVSEKELVVISDQSKLRDGQTVKIKK